ncbi:MAG: DUF2589 domain-containing protein [Cystobacterineae bacterium]|nr:DUF2589 domain-containing protein [Cystobacterineae bacterium]
MADIDLSKLISALAIACKEAQVSLESYQLNQYLNHFERTSDEQGPLLVAKSIRIALPPNSQGPRSIDVPTVSVVRHDALVIDEMRVRLAIDASFDKGSEQMRAAVGPSTPQRANEEAPEAKGPSSQHVIELVLKRDEKSEGVSRLLTEISSVI